LIGTDGGIRFALLLLRRIGRPVHAAPTFRAERSRTTMTEAKMSRMQRDGQTSKKGAGDQAASTAPQAPQAKGLNGLLETVRQKMAYTIRGI
jgi:hypothetical protein